MKNEVLVIVFPSIFSKNKVTSLVMNIKRNEKLFVMAQFTTEQLDELNDKLKTPEEVLTWGLENMCNVRRYSRKKGNRNKIWHVSA